MKTVNVISRVMGYVASCVRGFMMLLTVADIIMRYFFGQAITGAAETMTFSEEEQKKARLTIAGKLEHYHEIRNNFKIAMARKDLDQIPGRLNKYEYYGEIEKET